MASIRGMVVGWTIPAVLLLTACGGGEVRRPRRAATVLLDWRLTNPRFGDEVLTIMSNGQATWSYTPHVPLRPAERAQATMTSGRFRAARLALERTAPCRLRSQREGERNEPRGVLRLALPGMRCTVTMWDGEWRIEDEARDVLIEIEKLRDWLRDVRS